MPARHGPRPHITTYEILRAIDARGPTWTAVFTAHEITTVNESLDRELLAGNLRYATTLSRRGRLELERLRGAEREGRIDLRIDHECDDHDSCWVVSCTRCRRVLAGHVAEDQLELMAHKAVTDHRCAGPPVDGQRARAAFGG